MRCSVALLNPLLITVLFLMGLQVFSVALPLPAVAGPSMDCDGTIQSWILSGYYQPGDCHCAGGQPVCNKSSAGGHKHGITSRDINTMIVGTLFESLLTAMFVDNTASAKEAQNARQKAAVLAAAQAAENKRAQDAIAQAEFEKMMRSYKQLGDSQSLGYKPLSDATLDYKTMDGEMEALAANARKPFDAPPQLKVPGPETVDGGTPFFGDSMPLEDIRILVDPETDPDVVDLRKASTYVIENIKKYSVTRATASTPKDIGGPNTQSPECADLARKLDGFVHQRHQFQKTIDLSQEQYDTWHNANRNALLNAAKDGVEYFSGQLLEALRQRGRAAERLQQIYQKNAQQMAQEGLNTAAIEASLKRLKALSATARISELTGNITDWQSFIKNGVSGLMTQLSASNQEIQGLLEDPRMQKYFEMDAPELKALFDISQIAASANVFGKWVAKKLPIIGGVELSINQSYNALDWYLSYKRIKEANQINSRVMAAARSIQHNIDTISMDLERCH
ncbi:MAG: hypothetical protein VR64_22340 [Desulfatitalea sp. BRH_c12]|nr:MAG: hypothetical protein VR64_22340 [Desulfatitalea sp. BRH_c12]